MIDTFEHLFRFPATPGGNPFSLYKCLAARCSSPFHVADSFLRDAAAHFPMEMPRCVAQQPISCCRWLPAWRSNPFPVADGFLRDAAAHFLLEIPRCVTQQPFVTFLR